MSTAELGKPAASDSERCIIHEEGARANDASIPAGHWMILDDEDHVFVSGLDLVAVYGTGIELGLDMEHLAVDRAPSTEADDFLERGGSVFFD